MKNRREIFSYTFYDLDGMERHLEQMASKGWMLMKITNWGWCYERCEPKVVHFTVSYYPKASAFETNLR